MRYILTALVCGCMMAAVALGSDTAADLGPRLTAAGETRTVSVPLAGVAKVVAGRETIFETDGPGGGVPDLAP